MTTPTQNKRVHTCTVDSDLKSHQPVEISYQRKKVKISHDENRMVEPHLPKPIGSYLNNSLLLAKRCISEKQSSSQSDNLTHLATCSSECKNRTMNELSENPDKQQLQKCLYDDSSYQLQFPDIILKNPSLKAECKKTLATDIRGNQKKIYTGYIDQSLINNIYKELVATIGIPNQHEPFRRQHNKDILDLKWEAYLPKEQSSQGMNVCYGDAGLIRESAIPMPGEEPDREIIPAALNTITKLVDAIHTLNPDIKVCFGLNALRLTAINYYFHHTTATKKTLLKDLCLNWHVDKSSVGQLIACINLSGERTLKIRHQGKLIEIQSNKPGHFYLLDGTQFEHAVQLTSNENSMVLVLRSPFVPKDTDVHHFFESTDIFLPTE